MKAVMRARMIALCGGKGGGKPGPCPGDHTKAQMPNHVEIQQSQIGPGASPRSLRVVAPGGVQHTFEKVDDGKGGWNWQHQATGQIAGSRESNRLDRAAYVHGVK